MAARRVRISLDEEYVAVDAAVAAHVEACPADIVHGSTSAPADSASERGVIQCERRASTLKSWARRNVVPSHAVLTPKAGAATPSGLESRHVAQW